MPLTHEARDCFSVLLVLDRGELVEKGTHKRLLERHGLYRQLWEAQSSKPRRAVAPIAPVPAEAASGA